MTRAEQLRYAEMGAAARLTEIATEIAHIGRTFPDLSAKVDEHHKLVRERLALEAANGNGNGHQPTKRKPVSAAARKRMGAATKARWAALRRKHPNATRLVKLS